MEDKQYFCKQNDYIIDQDYFIFFLFNVSFDPTYIYTNVEDDLVVYLVKRNPSIKID
jgi:hypothetical protein